MKRADLIQKTLASMNCPSSYLGIAKDALEKRLIGEDFLVCGDFPVGAEACCSTCHTFYAHYDMQLIQSWDGRLGWTCCAVAKQIMKFPSLGLDLPCIDPWRVVE